MDAATLPQLLPDLLRQMATLLEQQQALLQAAIPQPPPPPPPAKKKAAYKLTPAERAHIKKLVKKTLYGVDY